MNEKIHMNSLSIVGASTCNLACDYCFLCNLRSIKTWDTQLIDSVKDGSYLKTVLNVIKATNNDPLEISDMTFWGGESTLHLDLWAEHFSDWLKAFPNVRVIKFISNGTYKPESLVAFAKTVDKNSEHRIILHIQLSIDGDDRLNEKLRGIKTSILMNNYEKFQSLLVREKFKHLEISFAVKPTIPVDDYNELFKDLNSATEYVSYLNDLQDFMNDSIYSKIVKHARIQPLILTTLYEYTQQQGLNFVNGLRNQDAVDYYELTRTHSTRILPQNVSPMSFFSQEWNKCVNYPSIGYCNQMLKECLIRPDGVIVPCLAGLFIDMQEYIEKSKDDPEEMMNILRVPKRYIFDPLNMSKDEILDFQLYLENMDSRSSNMFLNMAMSQMFELAVAGQISPIYLNNDILLRHAHILCAKTSCYFNSLRKTGIPYAPTMGFFRLYCNGAMEYLDAKMRFYK